MLRCATGWSGAGSGVRDPAPALGRGLVGVGWGSPRWARGWGGVYLVTPVDPENPWATPLKFLYCALK